jgi:ATP/maltotriose-dependent transcriptional regulator MalT
LTSIGQALRILGDLPQARDYFNRAHEVAQRIGMPTGIAYAAFLRGQLVYLMGQWEAWADFERAAGIVREVGQSWVSLYTPLGMGLVRLMQGRREEARQYLEVEAMALAARVGNLYVLRWGAPNAAEGDLLDGRPEAARDRIEPWLDAPGQEEADVTAMLPFLAWAYLDLGEAARAEATAAEGVRRAEAGGTTTRWWALCGCRASSRRGRGASSRPRKRSRGPPRWASACPIPMRS